MLPLVNFLCLLLYAVLYLSHDLEVMSMTIRPTPQISDEEYSAKLASKDQTIDGAEIPDPTPEAPPIGYVEQPSLIDSIRNMVRNELSQRARDAGEETFEEADDFDVPDDLVPMSGFENDAEFDPPLPPPDPTGVPSPGGGEGAGGTSGSAAPEVAPATPAAPEPPKSV